MRAPVYSLRIGILAHLAFLILAAMLLINVVMVKFSEKDLIQAKVNSGRLVLHALGQAVGYEIIDRHRTWDELRFDSRFTEIVKELLKQADFSEVLIINKEGIETLVKGQWGEAKKQALILARDAMATRKWTFDFYGSTWGVIWLAHENVKIAAPIQMEDRLLGGMTISAHLGSTYQILRKSERIILLYVLLNTVIFVLFGIYLLSRTVVKPIHRLLQVTEDFEGEESFPLSTDVSPNEIGQLHRSLVMMLKRLEDNKKALKTHISSLEKANQEIRKAQDEIIRSEKLASVGRLATGLAHEIGNPIGIVLGYLDLLKRGDVSEEEKHDFLERIESEVTRISHILRQLLDFSRPTSTGKEETHLHDLIKETLELMKPQPMMGKINLQYSPEATSDAVYADPNQLRQVFLNILINAADAIGEKGPSHEDTISGTVTIKTKNINDSIEMTVEDTGPGIPEELLGHIFDPFFTTKDPGKGTGMGLSVCYRILEGLGGKIRAESRAGEGTRMIIQLPLHHAKQS